MPNVPPPPASRGTVPLPYSANAVPYINHFGNSEAIALGATIAALGSQPFTRFELIDELVERQSVPAAANRNFCTALAHRAITGLTNFQETIGTDVIKSTHPERHRILQPFKSTIAAYGGALLSWSLDKNHQNISLQHAFGAYKSIPGQAQSPVIRYTMYSHLLRAPDGVRQGDLLDAILATGESYTPDSVSNQVERLAAHGILLVTSKHAHYNPSLELTKPASYFADKSERPSQRFDSPNYRLRFAALARLARQDNKIHTLDDILRMCLILDPEASRSELRLAMLNNIKKLPWATYIPQEPETSGRAYTHVVLSDVYRNAIADLYERIMSLGKPKIAKQYADQAQDIIDSPNDVALLFYKHQDFSAHANGRRRAKVGMDTATVVLAAVTRLGSGSVTAIYESIRTTDYIVPPLDKETIESILRMLAKAGRLEKTREKPNPHMNRTLLHYRIPRTKKYHE